MRWDPGWEGELGAGKSGSATASANFGSFPEFLAPSLPRPSLIIATLFVLHFLFSVGFILFLLAVSLFVTPFPLCVPRFGSKTEEPNAESKKTSCTKVRPCVSGVRGGGERV